MIVIISENNSRTYLVCPGDTMSVVCDEEVVLCEAVTKTMTVDYYAIFVFADDTGKVLSPNMCGIFARYKNLPEEITTAKRLYNLTEEQKLRFAATAPFEVLIA